MSEIDPDIQRFVSLMRDDWKDFPPFDDMSIAEQRSASEKVRKRWTKGGPVMARTEEFDRDFGAGRLRVRIYHPTAGSAPAPALVYLHGGGFMLFSIDTHDRLMREYAAKGGFIVIGIDYPLAPEHKYPMALNRIEALMLWLEDHGEEWGIDPSRLAMGGDSAGANLSFATFMRLRERGRGALTKAIVSNYGGFSPTISDESEQRFGGAGSIMDREEARKYWDNYLRDEKDLTDPFAAPILADLDGFPPVFLAVPELDIVAEHSFAMHQRLEAAGVEVTCRVYRGAVHSFLEAMSISPLARVAIGEGADFIAKRIRSVSPNGVRS